jgi:hypothetical protein
MNWMSPTKDSCFPWIVRVDLVTQPTFMFSSRYLLIFNCLYCISSRYTPSDIFFRPDRNDSGPVNSGYLSASTCRYDPSTEKWNLAWSHWRTLSYLWCLHIFSSRIERMSIKVQFVWNWW